MQAGIHISSFAPLMKDRDGLKRVLAFMADIGCTVTQLQWIDKSIPPAEVAGMLREFGITTVGVQDKARAVAEDEDYYMSLTRLSGAGDMCLSGVCEMGREAFIALADKLHAKGVTLSCHPTKRDFEGALDFVMERCPYLRLVPDSCQFHDACKDMLSALEKYAGRIETVHFKDRNACGALCPAGEGLIDFERITRACKKANVQYLLAEQETWADAFKELACGFKHTKMLAESSISRAIL